MDADDDDAEEDGTPRASSKLSRCRVPVLKNLIKLLIAFLFLVVPSFSTFERLQVYLVVSHVNGSGGGCVLLAAVMIVVVVSRNRRGKRIVSSQKVLFHLPQLIPRTSLVRLTLYQLIPLSSS